MNIGITTIAVNQKKTLVTCKEKALKYILSCQLKDGAVPWFKDGKIDPWDHTEALIALSIGGHHAAFLRGFEWLATRQNSDGSWFNHYAPEQTDKQIDTNFVAYPATGLWHHYLVTQNTATLERFFPVVEKAIDFVVSHQSLEGDIQWAISADKTLARDALVTASSSILRSLECAICMAEILLTPCQHWKQSYEKLYNALKNKPWRFDRTWESKERFSMDWFYPILAGIYAEREAQLRLEERWETFYEAGIGCLCVSDEPWVTIAESCELSIALCAANRKTQALKVLSGLTRWQHDDGGFWTGYNFRDRNIWPKEKTTWTAAVFVLAVDAVYAISPAAHLFTEASTLSN